MQLTFLGTRGNIEAWSRRHRRHASMLVAQGRTRVMIDCGDDWLGHLSRVRPGAIVLTHAHSDHVGGLAEGAPCPVYATTEVWKAIDHWPISARRLVEPYQRFRIGSLGFEAVPVQHSIRAPAVGHRIGRERGAALFYVPDVLAIPERRRAFAGVDLYVGDGARVRRPIQRWQGGTLTGHASVASQIEWCVAEGIRRAVFTHCGTGLVTRAREDAGTARTLGRNRGLDVQIAFDGMQVTVG